MSNKVRCAHILVKTMPEAQAICDELKKGADFRKLAEKSLCPSRKKCGDLGYFSHGMMVRPFEQVAFKLQKGEVSEPVKTEFGWHVIKRLD